MKNGLDTARAKLLASKGVFEEVIVMPSPEGWYLVLKFGVNELHLLRQRGGLRTWIDLRRALQFVRNELEITEARVRLVE